MRIKTTTEMIAVMQAFDEGKDIEALSFGDPILEWFDVTCPNWNWNHFDYRVKEKSKFIQVRLYEVIATGEVRAATKEDTHLTSTIDKYPASYRWISDWCYIKAL